jgi:hypothetical protein
VELGIPLRIRRLRSLFPARAGPAGVGTALLTAKFEDDSALCDNISVVIAQCNPDGCARGRAEAQGAVRTIRANPSQSLVDRGRRPAQHEQARKRVAGLVRSSWGGQNIAGCSSTLKVGDFEETKTSSFSLPHCIEVDRRELPVERGMRASGMRDLLRPTSAGLLGPYCSTTVGRDCMTDAELRATVLSG